MHLNSIPSKIVDCELIGITDLFNGLLSSKGPNVHYVTIHLLIFFVLPVLIIHILDPNSPEFRKAENGYVIFHHGSASKRRGQ